jgi:DNA-binding LacI/PurR family transcriptional regulator/biotin operon repressor
LRFQFTGAEIFCIEDAMNPLQRTGVAEEAAGLLVSEIAAGRLKGKLPSSRNLAALLKVSRPTVLQSLQFLKSQGIIEQSGGHRNYSVVESAMVEAGAWKSPVGERHALYLLDQEGARHEAFEILLSLAMGLHGKGWRISSLSMNFGHNENRPQQWQRAVMGYAPDKVIVLTGTPLLAQWLHRVNIPALFIGGDSGDTPLPTFAISASRAIDLIVSELIQLGHERIWLPLCNRPESYTARLQEIVHNAFEANGLPFSTRMHTPSSPYRGPDVITAMFEQAWSTYRPTAIILHDWREYIAVSSILRREGLDIPKHMSVALIGDDFEIDWHRPKLAHFRAPLGLLANACAKWLTSDDSKHLGRGRVFKAEWVSGESIAAPRTE